LIAITRALCQDVFTHHTSQFYRDNLNPQINKKDRHHTLHLIKLHTWWNWRCIIRHVYNLIELIQIFIYLNLDHRRRFILMRVSRVNIEKRRDLRLYMYIHVMTAVSVYVDD